GRRCLVVGGGDPAEEKVRGLLEAGASVSVVADSFNSGLTELGETGGVELLARGFQDGDVEGCFIVVDASGDDAGGERVAAAARERGVLVNVLDRPALCDFIAPALVRRGPLQVAISTAGRSPFMAAEVRRTLEAQLGEEYGRLVELVGELRDRLRAEGMPLARQQEIYARVPASGALDLLRAGDLAGARRAVAACAEG
ncbi:MAG: precorrin-2 dehydrogenase, partial [Chloroflexota bacterium]|nr:precorrin-2 dehydrogenase [Chloroflexota bacterium]